MMYIIFISNITGFYTYIILNNKNKTKNKKCHSEGSNSELSTYL